MQIDVSNNDGYDVVKVFIFGKPKLKTAIVLVGVDGVVQKCNVDIDDTYPNTMWQMMAILRYIPVYASSLDEFHWQHACGRQTIHMVQTGVHRNARSKV
jgi:hypothetical protein